MTPYPPPAVFGHEHALALQPASLAAKVSRRQFEVLADAGAGGARVVSLARSTNPTKVLRPGQPPLVLTHGQSAALAPGDRVLLMATDPSVFVELGASSSEAGAAAAAAAARRVALVLVGISGSGKSTFAAELARRSARPWRRVNQDTIDGGGRGTREQCLQAARAALQAGQDVIVDRTNVSREQRAGFIDAARSLGAEVGGCGRGAFTLNLSFVSNESMPISLLAVSWLPLAPAGALRRAAPPAEDLPGSGRGARGPRGKPAGEQGLCVGCGGGLGRETYKYQLSALLGAMPCRHLW